MLYFLKSAYTIFAMMNILDQVYLKSNHHLYEKKYNSYVEPYINNLEDFNKSLLGFDPVKEVKEFWWDVSIKLMIKNNIKSMNRFFSQ